MIEGLDLLARGGALGIMLMIAAALFVRPVPRLLRDMADKGESFYRHAQTAKAAESRGSVAEVCERGGLRAALFCAWHQAAGGSRGCRVRSPGG